MPLTTVQSGGSQLAADRSCHLQPVAGCFARSDDGHGVGQGDLGQGYASTPSDNRDWRVGTVSESFRESSVMAAPGPAVRVLGDLGDHLAFGQPRDSFQVEELVGLGLAATGRTRSSLPRLSSSGVRVPVRRSSTTLSMLDAEPGDQPAPPEAFGAGRFRVDSGSRAGSSVIHPVLLRNWIAVAICSSPIAVDPARSATVRPTLRIRPWARPLSCQERWASASRPAAAAVTLNSATSSGSASPLVRPSPSRSPISSRAIMTRFLTASDPSPGGPASASAVGWVTATTRSIRSTRAPLSAARYRRADASLQRQRGSSSPRPQGQGLAAATRVNRLGRVCLPFALEMVTLPVSSGSLNASSAGRLNSQSSSRKSTPRWARVISPGRGGLPPPTSPAAETV